jgi:hypothetical protein
MRLENWYITIWGTHSTAHGDVYGHPTFNDGEHIRTSYLRQYSLKEGKVTTKNSTYLLGKPASEFKPPQEEDVKVLS